MSEEDKRQTGVGIQNAIGAIIESDLKGRASAFETRLSDSRDEIIEVIKNSTVMEGPKEADEDNTASIKDSDSVKVRDSYGNTLLDIGNVEMTEKFSKYDLTNSTLNWPLWLALYNDSWVFKRAIDKPAQDMIRCGITLKCNSNKKSVIYKKLNKYYSDFIELVKWGRLFGGSIAVMMFDTLKDDDYREGINIEKIKQAKVMKFYVVDRWYGVAPSVDDVVEDMDSFDYLKPKYYEVVTSGGSTIKFHHDYVLRFEGRTAPKLLKLGQLQGWGYAEGAHIINEISRDEKIKSSIQSLIDKSLIEVIKMSGMRGVFMGADTENEEQLRKRLEMVNWGRNFNSLTFLDKEDEYQQHNFSGLSGLAELLEVNMWQIAAALDMTGVLFGELKGGLSQESEALKRYDETINGLCEDYLRPVYEKFISLLYQINDINEEVDFTFNSLFIKQQDEEKMEAMQRFINLCSTLLQDGVLDAPQVAKALQRYSIDGKVDFGIDSEYIKKIEENESLNMEEFNFNEPNEQNTGAKANANAETTLH